MAVSETRPRKRVLGARVEVRELSLQAGDRLLLDRATARFEPGEVTLIVGPSGAGKSLFLRALCGLITSETPDVTVTGDVLLDGEKASRSGRSVGVVFQNFALFDELSPTENVRFAQAHGRKRSEQEAPSLTADEWLAELRVPTNVRTASLSGGQRQRVAIARALAYDPDVLLYDEPTSGLDAATSEQVADLIQATHASHRRTSIIVTHDHAALAPIADRIYLFDQDARMLREIPRSEWARLTELLHGQVHASTTVGIVRDTIGAGEEQTPLGRKGGFLAAMARSFDKALVGTSRTLEAVLATPWRLLPLWRSPLWGLRLFLHYLRLVAGVSAWIYVAIAGLIVGFVPTYFLFHYLPYKSYTEPLLIDDILTAVGYALYRILIPLMTMVLVAARSGAAVASDVGGKVYGRQIDALRTLRAPPQRYLGTGILYAFLLGGPFLVGVSFLAARLSSLLVFTGTHPEFGPYFWESHFMYELIAPGRWYPQGTDWMLAKTLVCSLGIAVIAYGRGMQPKYSSRDVSGGITSTILWSTLFVLIVHFAFAFFEFE